MIAILRWRSPQLSQNTIMLTSNLLHLSSLLSRNGLITSSPSWTPVLNPCHTSPWQTCMPLIAMEVKGIWHGLDYKRHVGLDHSWLLDNITAYSARSDRTPAWGKYEGVQKHERTDYWEVLLILRYWLINIQERRGGGGVSTGISSVEPAWLSDPG